MTSRGSNTGSSGPLRTDEKIAHDPILQFIAPEIIDQTVESLSNSPLDAIGLAFTSSSFKVGVSGEQELLARLSSVSHGIRLNTTGTAATAAIQALKLEKIAIIAPSWFDEDLCSDGKTYFRDQGLDIVSATPSGPMGGPLTINPAATATAVKNLVARTGAKAVFIAGNGQRAIGAIDQFERDLSITILTANQVLLWASFEGTDIRRQVEGYGRFFATG
ncbi:maleate cis-trans isomerase [Auritidibacter sp. NML130574]|uniref:aspartate racemase/maleate isomerase family protein n=1 Tax=Auritidibacter sp. NML130574 TaxID=2170745 RepID=UPI000D72AB3E|nr:maleate cis-trans isomerase [Auritidibacter sp. NML130574]AXR74699.1 maleate cis-trans isomerase [Auritidibacter sp. NML130574]